MTAESKPTLEQFEGGNEMEGNEKNLQETSDAIQLAEAVDSTKYSPWTPSMFRLYGCLVIAYLCGCLNGYDGSLMGGLNGMPTYLEYFHM
jgi:hypothetical protein